MRVKIKITILPAVALAGAAALLWPLWWASPAWGDEAAGGGSLAAFSGDHRLRAAIWALAAFVPAGSGAAGDRELVVEGAGGLPPMTISLSFGEPLDPWPDRLRLTFQAENSSPPVFLTLTDQRPFGGPNLALDGLSGSSAARREAENPALLLTGLLTRLNDRLLAIRPKLGRVEWRENGPGFESARTHLLYGARLGPDDLFLARFHPASFTFHPFHEQDFPGAAGANISGWGERLGRAAALINGGQFYPDRAYMGLLRRDGRSLSAGPHPQWKGFLVADPGPDAPEAAPRAAILDRETHQAPWQPEHYRQVMQSFMLLDDTGRVRVRDSYNLAGRAAIGEDQEGRIVLIMTPAAISLYDLATALKSQALGLARVMGLDGGFETQLLLREQTGALFSGGQFSITDKRAVYLPGYHPSLPAILAVEPRVIEEEQ
ncbi:MAG: phosphodiester glycosidase family protein [Candidatus Adiutrix sp.]|nr:phosphodiester glycosidase family protein [Candidatus Adiutrix sp.]